ncbi:MAG: isocitrate/isopropylmalate family dehydrogenase, partial [Methanobacteriaceae archaeon]
ADVIVRLRREMDLFANLRPVKSYPGANALFDNLDFMIVRENTEGLYVAQEELVDFRENGGEGATAKRIITREASTRICDYAFNYAKTNGRKLVSGIHKANVLKKTDGLFKEVFYNVAKNYPEIESEDFYVDATAMYLITMPEHFDVIVTTNLYGDILSDEGAGLVGGLGLIPSANIGENSGVFEPVHGSAPDIAGKGLANPVAMMLSAVMMLEYLKETKAAKILDNAIITVLKEQKVVTGDIGGTASTMEVAKAVKEKIINS